MDRRESGKEFDHGKVQSNAHTGGAGRVAIAGKDTQSGDTDFDDDTIDIDAVDDNFANEIAGAFREIQPGFGNENSISLEKSWHGLHFLSTRDPWNNFGQATFLPAGGREVDEDMGYGSARMIDAAEMRVIDRTLQSVTSTELWLRFDTGAWQQAEIHCGCADEPKEDLRKRSRPLCGAERLRR